MLLQRLVETSERLASTSSRRHKTAIAADFLGDLADGERRAATAFLTGELPQGRIGIGPAALSRCTAPAAAQPGLSIAALNDAFARIAAVSGKGAGDRRNGLLRETLASATVAEQAFIGRLLLGELRQGALAGVITEGVAKAAGLDAALVRRATMLGGDLPDVAATALRDGAAGLAGYHLELFRPLQPMLAQPAEDVVAALHDHADAALEYKLDGVRVQVHRRDDQVRVFSRQLHDVTHSVPEIVDTALALPVRQFVLDGEVLALRDDARPQPFQVTMQRFGRRQDVAAMRQSVPLSLRVFDCLHADGDDLLDASYLERTARLGQWLPASLRVASCRTASVDEATEFLRRALAAGHEGVMVKSPSSSYQAGSRGGDWLKLKPVHTLDLVVLAAEWGSGRRRGWLSNLHLGARDPAGGFVMLGKTFKGLTDATLQWQTEQLLAREVARDGNTVHVRPELVVEVAFNELQRSPHYPAGLALRFARVRRYRADKPAGEADTLETVERIHAAGFAGLSA